MEYRQLGRTDLRVSSLCLGARPLPLPPAPPLLLLALCPSPAQTSFSPFLNPGTMLFGESTPPEEAERLLSAAAEAGINCFDSAEMYPVPQQAATQVGFSLVQ